MLMDETDKKPLASVSDGTEVRILAWRPGWSGSTRYRVRGTDSELEGWLPVNELRSTKVAIAPPTAVSPSPAIVSSVAPTAASDSGRRFGQR